jgi:hypothetical protein
MPATATTASPLSGEKLYQERARAALPLLVRQAEAATPICYSALARELGMPNPRNLNYVLGSIGQTMEALSNELEEAVPPIQCLVVNKNTGIPGEGIAWFLVQQQDYTKLPLRRKREIVQAELQHIYAYPHWRSVLEKLSLFPVETDFTSLIKTASHGFGGGESPEHRKLKEFVSKNPLVVGLPKKTPHGLTEVPLPSGDILDVSFQTRKLWLAVEVKSRLSNYSDIIRGIFQCVKYRAILEAVLLSEPKAHKAQDARAVLALESTLPESLVALSNLLAVEVIENIKPSGY